MKKYKYEAPHISFRTVKTVTKILVGSVVKPIKTKVQSQSVEDLMEDKTWETGWDTPLP